MVVSIGSSLSRSTAWKKAEWPPAAHCSPGTTLRKSGMWRMNSCGSFGRRVTGSDSLRRMHGTALGQ